MVENTMGVSMGQNASLFLYDDENSKNTAPISGVVQGARVMTLDGALPVEFLSVGDRVITRSGARVLTSLEVVTRSGEMVRIQPGALGHERPEHELLLPPETRIFLRDWRAEALYGAKSALVPVRRLVDGEFVTRVSVAQKRVFILGFESEEIIYVDGVQLATEPVRVGAKA